MKTLTDDEIREEAKELRNSRPECIPTNAEIGMNLINHLPIQCKMFHHPYRMISQGALSTKHPLPPKSKRRRKN